MMKMQVQNELFLVDEQNENLSSKWTIFSAREDEIRKGNCMYTHKLSCDLKEASKRIHSSVFDRSGGTISTQRFGGKSKLWIWIVYVKTVNWREQVVNELKYHNNFITTSN
jgi:hypothetical protein